MTSPRTYPPLPRSHARKRIVLSITLHPEVVQVLDEIAEEMSLTRSATVDRCLVKLFDLLNRWPHEIPEDPPGRTRHIKGYTRRLE